MNSYNLLRGYAKSIPDSPLQAENRPPLPLFCSLRPENQCKRLQFYTYFGISIGIKRRVIDNGKKITFYFLQNV